MSKMAALILAAGQGSRFGGCKQLIMIDDKPLLQHSIDIANKLCPGRVFAVSGAWHSEMSQAMENKEIKDVTLIVHSSWADGLGSSIARGVTFLSEGHDSILIFLADQIAIKTEDFIGLQSQFTGDNIVCGFYAGKRGVPAIFGRNRFESLSNLQGDHGAKALLYHPDAPVVEYPLALASIDIDTREDLDRWVKGRAMGSMSAVT